MTQERKERELREKEQQIGKDILVQIRSFDIHLLPSIGAKNYQYRPKGVRFRIKWAEGVERYWDREVIIIQKPSGVYNIQIGKSVYPFQWEVLVKHINLDMARVINYLNTIPKS